MQQKAIKFNGQLSKHIEFRKEFCKVFTLFTLLFNIYSGNLFLVLMNGNHINNLRYSAADVDVDELWIFIALFWSLKNRIQN